MGHAMAIFFAPPPGEGSKGQISFNFNYKNVSKIFYQTLCVCVCSLKHINQDFYSVGWVMSQGWNLGVLRSQKSNSVLLSVRYAISS